MYKKWKINYGMLKKVFFLEIYVIQFFFSVKILQSYEFDTFDFSCAKMSLL